MARSGTTTPFCGAVLAGGESRRMGRDKAFVEIDGEPLIARPIAALRAAGAGSVSVVGGDGARIGGLGVRVVADRWPGEGPLGGLLTALEAATEAVVVVLTCDIADLTAADVAGLVRGIGGDRVPGALTDPSGDVPVVAAPISGGQPQWLTAAWRAGAHRPLAGAFAVGERSVRRAVASLGLPTVTVSGIEPTHLVDLDTPDDVARWESGRARGSEH